MLGRTNHRGDKYLLTFNNLLHVLLCVKIFLVARRICLVFWLQYYYNNLYFILDIHTGLVWKKPVFMHGPFWLAVNKSKLNIAFWLAVNKSKLNIAFWLVVDVLFYFILYCNWLEINWLSLQPHKNLLIGWNGNQYSQQPFGY